MAEQLSLFDAPKPVYEPGPPDLDFLYKYLFSTLQRLRRIPYMPFSPLQLSIATQRFEEFCPLFQNEEADAMLVEYHALIAELEGTSERDEDTWLKHKIREF
jgi:hypothetical protein